MNPLMTVERMVAELTKDKTLTEKAVDGIDKAVEISALRAKKSTAAAKAEGKLAGDYIKAIVPSGSFNADGVLAAVRLGAVLACPDFRTDQRIIESCLRPLASRKIKPATRQFIADLIG
jgi:hypothetical protein